MGAGVHVWHLCMYLHSAAMTWRNTVATPPTHPPHPPPHPASQPASQHGPRTSCCACTFVCSPGSTPAGQAAKAAQGARGNDVQPPT